MTCSACGSQLAEAVKFCSACGTKTGYVEQLKCPKCHSSQVHAEKRGWNPLVGMFGSGRIIITCLRCNWRFYPGEGK